MRADRERIKKDIVDHLYWDSRVGAADVKVNVSGASGAEVRLFGSVPSYMARRAAESDAYAVWGVDSVKNDLTVKHPAGLPVPTDEELEKHIKGVLIMNSSIMAADIEVTVTGGVATLEGSVDSYWKKLKVEELALDVFGVTDTVNKIAIVPLKDFKDQTIADDILAALDRNGLVDIDKIDVKVMAGAVTLSGTVSGWRALGVTQKMAEHTLGVREVNNYLSIA